MKHVNNGTKDMEWQGGGEGTYRFRRGRSKGLMVKEGAIWAREEGRMVEEAVHAHTHAHHAEGAAPTKKATSKQARTHPHAHRPIEEGVIEGVSAKEIVE